MILVLAFIAGAAFGAFRARARGGSPADIAQYSLAHGFAAVVLGAAAALVAAFAGYAPF